MHQARHILKNLDSIFIIFIIHFNMMLLQEGLMMGIKGCVSLYANLKMNLMVPKKSVALPCLFIHVFIFSYSIICCLQDFDFYI